MCKVGDVFGLLGGKSGPSAAEKAAAAQSANMAQTLQQNYSTEFKNQGDMLNLLQGETQKISTGQTGEGFSPEEMAARTSEIVNNAAAGERNAQQAVQNNAAGMGASMGGDSSGLARATGIRQQVAGQIATAGENNKSNALLANTAADYNQGRTNANEAAGLYGSLAGDYGQRANSSLTGEQYANSASFNEAGKNRETQDAASPGAMIGGLIKTGIGLAGDFATGGMSGLMGSLGGGGGTEGSGANRPVSEGGLEYGGYATPVPPGGDAGSGSGW